MTLTPHGAIRRDQMRESLRTAVTQRRRGRTRQRIGAAGATALALAVGVILMRQADQAPDTRLAIAPAAATQPATIATDDAPAGAPPVVTIVTVGRETPNRVRIARGRPTTVEIIGDEALLSIMAEQGRPCGIIRIEGRATLAGQEPQEDEESRSRLQRDDQPRAPYSARMWPLIAQDNADGVETAAQLLWLTVGITAVLLISLAIAFMLLVRHMQQVGSATRSGKRRPSTAEPRDGWTEAGRRIEVPPGELGTDDDDPPMDHDDER